MPTKDKGTIKKLSGGIWSAIEVTDAGAIKTGQTQNDFGYVQSSTLTDTTEILEDFDESGALVVSEEGNRTVKITGLLMQSDKSTIDFFNDTVRGKYYMVYHYDGVNNGNHQEYVFGICRINPKIELASGTKRIPFEITVMKNDAALGMGGTGEPAIPSGTKALTFDIPAGKYYSITETAVS